MPPGRFQLHLPHCGQSRDGRGGGECDQDDEEEISHSHAVKPGVLGNGEISPSSQSCSWASAVHARAIRA